jgi:hypothetical protein
MKIFRENSCNGVSLEDLVKLYKVDSEFDQNFELIGLGGQMGDPLEIDRSPFEVVAVGKVNRVAERLAMIVVENLLVDESSGEQQVLYTMIDQADVNGGSGMVRNEIFFVGTSANVRPGQVELGTMTCDQPKGKLTMVKTETLCIKKPVQLLEIGTMEGFNIFTRKPKPKRITRGTYTDRPIENLPKPKPVMRSVKMQTTPIDPKPQPKPNPVEPKLTLEIPIKVPAEKIQIPTVPKIDLKNFQKNSPKSAQLATKINTITTGKVGPKSEMFINKPTSSQRELETKIRELIDKDLNNRADAELPKETAKKNPMRRALEAVKRVVRKMRKKSDKDRPKQDPGPTETVIGQIQLNPNPENVPSPKGVTKTNKVTKVYGIKQGLDPQPNTPHAEQNPPMNRRSRRSSRPGMNPIMETEEDIWD